MSSSPLRVGRRYEALACAYLAEAGLTILSTGYRCRQGELDVVCRDREGLVIVEVRARRHASRVSAAESVDRYKQQRIIAATRHFLMRHPYWADWPLRFDVLAISAIDREPQIKWISNAFDVT